METIPSWILARFRDLDQRPHAPHGGGLINRTFLVEGRAGKVIVQRLHPVFAGVVNEDIDAVTAHLAAKGLMTPRPLRTDDGALWVDDEEGRAWRALSYVEGQSHDRVPSLSFAREAGRMVARFHAAVADLAYDYRHVRAGVHDTKKHLATLEAALDAHTGHRLFGEVEPLARRLLAEAARLPDLERLPLRHVHGDLKISNLLFQGEQAVCLVDLDTLGRMIWPFEMGDALRSWCNPAGEDVAHVAIDAGTFGAALAGYGEVARGAGLVSAEEAGAIVDGLATICLELSARFLADALREAYFGFDARRFPARGEHNLVRGRGQLALFDSVQARRTELEHVARAALD
ncbi:phosphotransferase enzyme family protein [Polyangium mundeleinium]|uniref:Phosphotransferase n=1 Tax=Polyangium mundeleinium TaxID=2995306 RepID=A0ABT5EMA7_9BACT|nr:phosphotransferase [Polyangium mundeleinium]MDC0742047.1 phosphotransferase [Polyangium mundeleinium]